MNHLFLRKFSVLILLTLLYTSFVLSCSQPQDAVVNVYSGRHYQADEQVFQNFTQKTGIKVNLIKANTDQLMQRLQLEGANSPADVFITSDAGRMVQAKQKNLLQPFQSQFISENIPAYLQDNQNYWVAFTQRARVLAYNPSVTDSNTLSTYEALATDAFNNKILVRSSQNHYNQTLFASILATHQSDYALKWAQGIVQNMARPPQGNDRDQIKAMAAGIGEVAIVNTYYMGLLLHSDNPEERRIAQQTKLFFPNQQTRGTHVNISAASIAAHAPNKEHANLLIEYLLSVESQRIFAEQNFEYPVHPKVEWPMLLQEWGTFKTDTTSVQKIANAIEEAVILLDKAEWQ
jgi:iron(III) transport system substrate-binding protein